MEEKIVDMELKKPMSIKVKTPLERELARLKGYGNADIAAPSDLVGEFNDQARLQKDAY